MADPVFDRKALRGAHPTLEMKCQRARASLWVPSASADRRSHVGVGPADFFLERLAMGSIAAVAAATGLVPPCGCIGPLESAITVILVACAPALVVAISVLCYSPYRSVRQLRVDDRWPRNC